MGRKVSEGVGEAPIRQDFSLHRAARKTPSPFAPPQGGAPAQPNPRGA